jgi:hypothetical protein
MDQSQTQELAGMELLSQLVKLTGLPSESVEKELANILSDRGIEPETMTLDDFRLALADYMEKQFGDLLEL